MLEVRHISLSERAGAAERARAARLAAEHAFEVTGDRRVEPALVVTRDGLALRGGGRLHRWHPGMIHALREAGQRNPWVRLGGLRRGDRVVDCTLGLGTDARFLAEVTGQRVLGLEAVPAIALLTREGLASVGADVEVRIGLATEILGEMPDASADAVIADPMFPADTGARGSSLDPVRGVARSAPLDDAWLAEALRVSRGPVIVKDRYGNDLLERLGAERIKQRRGRNARYGVWRPA